MPTQITVSSGTLGIIGAGALAFLTWLFKFALESVKRDVNKRWDEKDSEDKAYRTEQIEDSFRQQQGQIIMSDCLAQIMKHMITGNHIEDLEKQQARLEEFRTENERALLKKATKYNLRRQ